MASQWPPRKNSACYVSFPIYGGGSNVPVSGVTGFDSEISKDQTAFVDCTNEATEIGATGIYYLLLTSTEMNADHIVVQVKTTAYGTVVIVIDTIDLNDITTLPGFPGDLVAVAN